MAPAGANFTFTYTRSKAAADEGYLFSVEHSDTLANPWTPVGAGTKTSETDALETMEADIPIDNATRRFVRLKITPP